MEAFAIADKVMENEANAPTATPFDKQAPPQFRSSQELYQQLLDSMGRLNIDEALNRASKIPDPKVRLLSEISIADNILNDGKTEQPGIRIQIR